MRRKVTILLAALILLVAIPAAVLASEYGVPDFDFSSPLFGLATAPDGSLLVADTGAGVIELRKETGSEVVALPGVSDVAPIGRGAMFAVTGEEGIAPADTAHKLYRLSRDKVTMVADLLAFEEAVDPAGGEVESNPYDVAVLNGGRALVADAAGNDLLIVDNRGEVDWVATLPNEIVSTDNMKSLLGCPTPPPALPPELADVCDLPPQIPAEPMATSVAIGPDGAYYVGELKGFPAPLNESRVWRIEPGTRHAECGSSPDCSLVYDGGFTSIIDLAFGPDGTLYVVELDEGSWLNVELAGFGVPVELDGTVNACAADGSGCEEVASSLPIPSAAAVDKDGQLYATINALIPGAAEVIALP